MKKFYRWSVSERYRMFEQPARNIDDLICENIHKGLPLRPIFEEFSFRFEEKKRRNSDFSDFPYFTLGVPVISENALQIFREIIEPYVEITPISIVDSPIKFFALTVTPIYDVDEFRTDFLGNPEDGSSLPIITHAFPNDILPEAPVFRTKIKYFLSHFYLSDELKSIVESHKLKGLEFDLEMKYRMGEYEKVPLKKDTSLQPTPSKESSKEQYSPLTDPKNAQKLNQFNHYPKQNFGDPVTDAMLDELEKHFPRPLPNDYRDYLKICNGGIMELHTDKESLHFNIQGAPDWFGDEGILWILHSVNCEQSGFDLLENWTTSKEIMPPHFLPIGGDGGGNLVCLSLGTEDYGYIYCWSHEEEPYETDYSQSYFVAKSFSEFINSLIGKKL
jgi:cell wall assembly regulator SMI1